MHISKVNGQETGQNEVAMHREYLQTTIHPEYFLYNSIYVIYTYADNSTGVVRDTDAELVNCELGSITLGTEPHPSHALPHGRMLFAGRHHVLHQCTRLLQGVIFILVGLCFRCMAD